MHVILIGQNLSEVEEHLKACQDQYSFHLSAVSLGAKIPEGSEPLLAFVGAPQEERGCDTADTWVRLNDLQQAVHQRLVRAFVVSTGDYFDSGEAQKAWMNYSIVVGYDLQSQLTGEVIRAVLAEMVAMATDRGLESASRPVGSVLKMPAGEYDRHKFVSLFIGGMRDVLIQVRHVAHEIKINNPPPIQGGKLQLPFREATAQSRFDAVVEALYGAGSAKGTVGKPSGVPAWLQELRQQRVPGYVTPHLLLLGDTGNGKSLLARWFHRARFDGLARTDQDWQQVESLFQDLNCGGLPPNLVDSELFGGVAGAWTDLTKSTPGKIFCSCQGTLFLDEIGELPLRTQAVLLKFLDDGEYYPVGGHGDKLFIPTTIIAATNQPIEQLVAEGKFRRDLFERFRFRIRLPSLRERLDHFDHLVDFVLQNPRINPRNTEERPRVQTISLSALEHLRRYSWPGNFRELEQVLWKAVLQASYESCSMLLPRHLSLPS